jgi:hypothetical protein
MLKDGITTLLNMDPSITRRKISSRYGISYSPLSVSNAAGNNNTLKNYAYGNKVKDLESPCNNRLLL